MNDGNYILAQAKSVRESSSDFTSVRQNLQKALVSLSQGATKASVKQLILITNSPNPLNDDFTRNIFSLDAHRSYDTLPMSAKEMVDKYLSQISQPLDTSKFMIQILPFETDNPNERYKFVRKGIDDFIGKINLNLPGLAPKLMTIWHCCAIIKL